MYVLEEEFQYEDQKYYTHGGLDTTTCRTTTKVTCNPSQFRVNSMCTTIDDKSLERQHKSNFIMRVKNYTCVSEMCVKDKSRIIETVESMRYESMKNFITWPIEDFIRLIK